jgi:hypothetical protein
MSGVKGMRGMPGMAGMGVGGDEKDGAACPTLSAARQDGPVTACGASRRRRRR